MLLLHYWYLCVIFFFQAEDGIRDRDVTGVQTCALPIYFMLETIIAAGLLGVDAFDQPAVEQGKILARKYLAEMG